MSTDIPQGLISFSNDTQHKFGQIRRVYDKQERAVINLFKNEYMEATSPSARKLVCQLNIFPALFNYWETIGVVLDDDEKVSRGKVGRVF